MKELKGIIVEGCDCSGKSTLINDLRIELSPYGFDVIALKHKNDDQFERYIKSYMNNDLVIYDRSHFSEIIYGNLWRDSSGFRDYEEQILNKYAEDHFISILAQAPIDILMSRYNSRDEVQVIKQDELEKTQNAFKKVITGESTIQYSSVNLENRKKVINEVISKVKSRNRYHEIIKKPSHTAVKKDFILIEGCNGSGKSTISKLLKINMVGWGIKTLDYKEGDKYERYLSEYLFNKNTILDRGHFSEIVYGNIFRNKSHFYKEEIHYLNKVTNDRGIVIFCNPEIDVIKKRINNLKYPKHIHENKIDQVVNEFKEVLKQSKLNVIEINTENTSEVEKLIQEIKSNIDTKSYVDMGWGKSE